MNYEILQTQLLQVIRGKRSQLWISRKLGFTFNQVYRWESRTCQFYWENFWNLCSSCGIDLEKILTDVILRKIDYKSETKLFSELTGQVSIAELVKKLKVSRYKIIRWQSGKTKIPFSILLRVWNELGLSFYLFLTKVVDVKKLRELLPYYAAWDARNQLFRKFPYAGLLMWGLLLHDYQDHPSLEFLSKTLAISVSEIQEALEELQRGGFVLWKDQRWQPTTHSIDTRGLERDISKSIRKYWLRRADRALDGYLGSPQNKDTAFGYLEFSSTQEQLQEIFELYIKFYHNVRAIVVKEPGKQKMLSVLSVQLFHPHT